MAEERKIEAGNIVRHFKRETVNTDANPCAYLYKILSMDAYHSETKERLVVYESLYANDDIQVGHVCARPYDMFMSEVEHEKYPDIKQKYRFELNGPSRLLKCDMHVRYAEDGRINGERDSDTEPKMPFLSHEQWKIDIDVEQGRVLNWPEGIVADTYYKVCDECEIDYVVNGQVVCNNDGIYYCPDFLSLEGHGYGDYVILHIDENGMIRNWDSKLVDKWVERHDED